MHNQIHLLQIKTFPSVSNKTKVIIAKRSQSKQSQSVVSFSLERHLNCLPFECFVTLYCTPTADAAENNVQQIDTLFCLAGGESASSDGG